MQRKPWDLDSYTERIQQGPCFLCELVRGNPELPHHIIYEDDNAIAFLNKYPSLYGHTLVAPKRHREQVTGDFTLEEYQTLQTIVYRVSEAIRRVLQPERIYILSLGSQQGNRHVHWHIAPLPPGVPYERQQLQALAVEEGFLDLSDEEMAELAARIGQAVV